MADIVTLQARLEQAKREQTEVKKQLRAKKAELRNQAKVARKLAREGQPSFWQKCSALIDKTTLACCKPFEKRAEAVRHKQEDPEGYEADVMFENVERMVKYFEKKAEKRELKEKDTDLLIRLDTMLMVSIDKNLGRTPSSVKESIRQRIRQLLPEATKTMIMAIDCATPATMLELMQQISATESAN